MWHVLCIHVNVFMSTCHLEVVECGMSYVFMSTCHQEVVECGMSDVFCQPATRRLLSWHVLCIYVNLPPGGC